MEQHDHMGHMHEASTGAKEGKRGMWHWACCVGPILSWILWIAAATSFALAWVSVLRVELIWGLGPDWWLWNALIFGVLALPGCGRKMARHGCNCGGCKDGICNCC